jgi:hypothetical protein
MPLRDAALKGRIGRVADFFRYGPGGSLVAIQPPNAVVRDIESLGSWDFPALAGVVEVPVLRPDGTVLDQPGYDQETRLYYHPAQGLQVPLIPDDPSPADIETAADLLADVLHDFPFEDDASRANAFAAMITPILRPAINGPLALALLDAPQQGTGKSLLASTIALIATGRPASMMAAPDSDEEWRKRITATLYSGANVINIDNIEGQLKAPSLASALTSEIWRDRMLGRSETLELPQRATWLATGNNIRLGGDLQRRSYWIRLDAKSATPWLDRKFKHPNLAEWVLENRGRIVAAILTLARAWVRAADRFRKPEASAVLNPGPGPSAEFLR